MSHGYSLFLPALAAVSAAAYLPLSPAGPSWIRSGVKTAPMVLLAVFAAQAHLPAMVIVALALSALGDFALSRKGETAFQVGLASFLLAHLFYIAAFLQAGSATVQPLLIAGLVLWLAAAEVWLVPFAGAMRWPVRAYSLVISVMLYVALTCPPLLPFGAVGAALFMASDTILSLRLFRLDPTARTSVVIAEYAVWISYVAAQALILFAFLSAPT
jgi:uncharacterized membrane protein YhhN